MNCPGSEELVALIDGALSPEALAAARRHVDGCAACGAELARLQAGVASLRAGSPAPEPSPYFAARLAARLAAEPPPRRGLASLLRTPRWAIAFAGAAALALAGGVVAQRVHRERRAVEIAVAERLELLENYEVVASVGDVDGEDDVAVVAALDQLSPREGRP